MRKKRNQKTGDLCLAFLFRYDGRRIAFVCTDHVRDPVSGTEKL